MVQFLGSIITYGIELIHLRREGRSKQQIGRKGKSNSRWIVGGKLCLLLNHLGLVVDWDCDTANVYDGSAFQHVVEPVIDQIAESSDVSFAKKGRHLANLGLCSRGEWNSRMMIETALSVLTLICHFRKVMHRRWAYLRSRVGYTMASFNLPVQWHGLEPGPDGMVCLSIAEFSL